MIVQFYIVDCLMFLIMSEYDNTIGVQAMDFCSWFENRVRRPTHNAKILFRIKLMYMA